nr:NACHT domain-containing protein [Nonomuraea sp. FMUSA5-5]
MATDTITVRAPWWTPTTWTATGLLVLGAMGLLVLQARTASLQDRAAALDHAVEALRRRLEEQYAYESVLRRLRQPLPIQVRWISTARPIAAARDVVMDPAAAASASPAATWAEKPLAGATSQIVERYRSLTHRQLVIIGEPGAGKSGLALLLALGLLEEAVEGEPVPVLITMSAWSPQQEDGRKVRQESFESFAARYLTQTYPDVLGTVPEGGLWAAEQLIKQARLLLILDGLDEMPAHQHAPALRRLDDYAALGRPLVVTSRIREYEQAVRDHQQLISRAAVVELQPVGIDQAIEYLSHPEPAYPRWEPVFTYLLAQRDSALARVLSTPLMVSLARAAYQSPSTDPAELTRIPGEGEIRASLIDTYITGVHNPAPPTPPGHKPPNVCPAHIARRYLETLALQLHLSGTVELLWWQLRADLFTHRPYRALFCLASLVCVLVAGAAATMMGLMSAVWITIALGIPLILASGDRLMPWPTYDATPRWYYTYGRIRDFLHQYSRPRRLPMLRAGIGTWCGLLTGLIIGDLLEAVLGAAVAAMIVPFLRGDRIGFGPGSAMPKPTLRAQHSATLSAATMHAAAGSFLFTVIATFTHSPAPWTTATVAAFVFGWTAACLAGLWTWLAYRATHLRLVIRRRLPLRLNAFLQEELRRGTLRRTGTTWQFRHLILQEHLARTIVPEHLTVHADHGHVLAGEQLAKLLLSKGQRDELCRRADRGDWPAGRALAEALVDRGEVSEAIASLRRFAAHPNGYIAGEASDLLVEVLLQHGRVDDAISLLAAQVAHGRSTVLERLADVLVGQDRAEDAIALLQEYADRDDPPTSGEWRISYLAERQLVKLLAERGRANDLRARVEHGSILAVEQLAKLLSDAGAAEEAIALLRAHVERANVIVLTQLAELLAAQGRRKEAIALLRPHAVNPQLLWLAHNPLAKLLADEGDLEEAGAVLREQIRSGWEVSTARTDLAALLVRQGQVEEAITILSEGLKAGAGLSTAIEDLTKLLVHQGQIEEAITMLQHRVERGDDWSAYVASMQLVDLLLGQGRTEDAIVSLRGQIQNGVLGADDRLVTVLTDEGRLEEAIVLLHERADAGDWHAAVHLAELLVVAGRVDEAILLLRAAAGQGVEAATALWISYASSATRTPSEPVLRFGGSSGRCGRSSGRRSWSI